MRRVARDSGQSLGWPSENRAPPIPAFDGIADPDRRSVRRWKRFSTVGAIEVNQHNQRLRSRGRPRCGDASRRDTDSNIRFLYDAGYRAGLNNAAVSRRTDLSCCDRRDQYHEEQSEDRPLSVRNAGVALRRTHGGMEKCEQLIVIRFQLVANADEGYGD